MEEVAKVLIAGGGPAGLTLANELARLGVDSVVFERLGRHEYLPPPKTNMTNVRSMTLFRRLGIADAVREADPRPQDWPNRVIFVSRLNGYLLSTFEEPFNTGRAGEVAPEAAEWAPEYSVTYPLRALAERNSIDVRYGKEVIAVDQDDAGVTVDVCDVVTGAIDNVRGLYLAGCDGSESTVRRALGVRLQGLSGMRQNLSVFVRAPRLGEIASRRLGYACFYWLVNPDCAPLIVPQDPEHWQFHLVPLPEGFGGGEDELRTLISLSAGEDVGEIEILNGGPWTLSSVLAPSFRRGRAFLVGDAAHLISPLGGFGMNISVLDAVDLAWKLAGTLQRWGGPKLLDAYTAERRYADRYVMDIQEQNAAILGPELLRPDLEEPGAEGERARKELDRVIQTEKLQEFDSLFCQLGYRYENSPLVVGDGTEPLPLDSRVYTPSAHPGCLAPHAWLNGGVSLYDRFDPFFTLLRLDPALDVSGFIRAAEEVALPVEVLTLESPRLLELYEQPLALIRPDQHVAWRGAQLPAEPRGVLDIVRGA